jgi:broad specificity phosphatase PhoE
VSIMPEVREQAAFACDIGSAPAVLASRFPHHDFAHLPPRWWNDGAETLQETTARANAFRAHMAARADSATTLLVGHWAFIQALTGVALANGEILEYDLA